MRFCLLIWVCLFVGMAFAEELSAEQILEKTSKQSVIGLENGTARVQMTIQKSPTEQKEQELAFWFLKDEKQKFQVLVRFEKPANLKGTAFRMRERAQGLPEQSIYIPASGASVKQVPPGNAAGSFFGSDFLFADLMPMRQSPSDAAVKRLPDSTIEQKAVYVVETIPKVTGSPYGKVVLYVDQKRMVPVRADFFDTKLQLLKQMEIQEWKKLDEQLSVPALVKMANRQKNSQTTLKLLQVNPKASLALKDFSDGAMTRR